MDRFHIDRVHPRPATPRWRTPEQYTLDIDKPRRRARVSDNGQDKHTEGERYIIILKALTDTTPECVLAWDSTRGSDCLGDANNWKRLARSRRHVRGRMLGVRESALWTCYWTYQWVDANIDSIDNCTPSLPVWKVIYIESSITNQLALARECCVYHGESNIELLALIDHHSGTACKTSNVRFSDWLYF